VQWQRQALCFQAVGELAITSFDPAERAAEFHPVIIQRTQTGHRTVYVFPRNVWANEKEEVWDFLPLSSGSSAEEPD